MQALFSSDTMYIASPLIAILWLLIVMILKSRREHVIGWASLLYAAGALFLGATATIVLIGPIIYNFPALIGCWILLACSVIQLVADLKSNRPS